MVGRHFASKRVKLLLAVTFIALVIIGALVFTLQDTTDSAPPRAEFIRRDMLENIALNIIVPAHQTFAERAATLEMALIEFRGNPTPQTLDAAQTAWYDAALAWTACELYDFRPVTIARINTATSPINEEFIENLIAQRDNIDESFIEGSGSNIKGLYAIEYLLFDLEGDDSAILTSFEGDLGPKRFQYLVALGENMRRKADELYNTWSPEGHNYAGAFINADSDAGDLQGSINMLANQMIRVIEHTANMRLGWPLGTASGGEIEPETVQARRSGYSLQLLIGTLEGLQRAFDGMTVTGDGLGYDDYLNYLDDYHKRGLLSQAIDQQFVSTLTSFREIGEPLDQAVVNNIASVTTAYNESKALLVLIKVDMPNRTGLIVTFSDNDGD